MSQNPFRLLNAAWIFLGSFCLVAPLLAEEATIGKAQEFLFHHDHILGTSLDLTIVAESSATAELVEKAILTEIVRLGKIFSAYDPASELSRLNESRAATVVSREMASVLGLAEEWQKRSGGAFHSQVGRLVKVWQQAEQNQTLPNTETLSQLASALQQPGWKLAREDRVFERLNDQQLNLNSLAKGVILQHAATAARTKVPQLQGLLLNLGGDLLIQGRDEDGNDGWSIGIQEASQPYDNANPLAIVRVRDMAIATSGGYQRYYTIQGKRYSHLFDPRTGRPATGIASATVLAPENTTANALATTLCVLPVAEGLRLVQQLPGVECLLVTDSGEQVRSPGFARFEFSPAKPVPQEFVAQKEAPAAANKVTPWPANYQVAIDLELPASKGGKYRRPYVAIWFEDAAGKPVRTISVWGNSGKYLKDLPDWWKFARQNNALVKATTRATRAPGKYQLQWDGKDDDGNALGQGSYTLHIEVHREHGRHVSQVGKIDCTDKGAELTLDKNAETEETKVRYEEKK